MLTLQSMHVLVPAKLQWFSVCPKMAQSFPVSVMEYRTSRGSWVTFLLLLRRRVGAAWVNRVSAICSLVSIDR